MENFKSKFVTAEAAVAAAVKDGDWVDYGFGGGYPELLDKALAARKGHLKDVKVRGGLVIRPRIEVVEADPEQESFSYYSWHIGDYERKLQTRGLVKFMPVVLRLLPTLYRQRYIRTDVASSRYLLRMRTATVVSASQTSHGEPCLRVQEL